jgi:DNA-binding transcriptional LysR family regulator
MTKIPDWDDYIGRRLRLRDLRVFFAVAQQGSMAKAAAQLRVSQPAVSQVIADLEHALGARLLDRGRRGVDLTIFGITLHKYAKAAFDELRQGVRQIEFLSDPTAGELRIGCPESISAGFLVRIVECLSKRYPRMKLSVQQLVTPSLEIPQLEKREVDLVLARLWPSPIHERLGNTVKVEVLFNDGFSIAVDRRNPLARRRKISTEELMNERWVVPPLDSPGSIALANAFRSSGWQLPETVLTTYSVSLRIALASTAQYVTALPTSVLRPNSKVFPLKELPVDLKMPPWPVAAVTPKDRALNPAIAPFLECARQVANL